MDDSLSPSSAEFFIAERRWTFPWIHAALFGATCLTTMVVGAFLMAMFNDTVGDSIPRFLGSIVRSPSILLTGLPFSFSIMAILLSHEMGHYLACRYYGIDATLPYFIPAPTIVGTMGAFIKIKSPIPNRSALLDVGIAGPIAGFVLSVPTLIYAVSLSKFAPVDPSGGGFSFGEPVIFKLVAALMGKTTPAGMDLIIHPIGVAAWFGFFATAINLLPAGQLDGGHVSYAIFGRFHKRISQAVLFTLIPLGIFFWPGWLVWSTVLMFIGLRHPMTLADEEPLSPRHKWLAVFGLAMLALCFTPVPFDLG